MREADTVFLLSYFLGNGEDGLHLAVSEDGLEYVPLGGGRSFLAPAVGVAEKLMRDPCLVWGPDGVFHLVWTCSWWNDTFGTASSRDLMNWGEQRAVAPFKDTPGVRNCWAPEAVYDEGAGEFAVFWSSTIEGRFPETAGSSESGCNHRLYYSTTPDFRSWSEARLLVDPGFNTIDGTFVRARESLYLIVKDETKFPEPRKHLRLIAAASYRGPFGPAGEPFTRGWVEGPTGVELADGRWAVLFDGYTTGRYEARATRDFRTWEDVTEGLSVPEGARHGSVIRVPRSAVAGVS